MRVTGVLCAAADATGTCTRAPRRRPADVTADRLVDHVTEWDRFNDRERDALGLVIHVVREIAAGER